VDDRRLTPRRLVDLDVMAAVSSERPLPAARAVDVSRQGLLMAFAEPLGFLPEHRLLVSLCVDDFRMNALASVVRCERGEDFRTYVAVTFADLYEPDYDELCRRLDEREHARNHAA
jgi:hypothetical protein